MKIVDAHHHLWQLKGRPLYYPWLQDPAPHEFFHEDSRRIVLETIDSAGFAEDERRALFHDNAARCYRL